MSGETSITVIGNTTSDPELRFTQAGKAVVNFTIASQPRHFDRNSNEWVDDEALFLRCSAWEEFAEHIAASLTKGTRVIAQGNLVQREYQTKEGEKRTSMELQVTAIGPDLRYATANVVRVQSNRNQQSNRETQSAQQNGGGQNLRDQGNVAYDSSRQQQRPPQQEPAGGGFPSSYDDEAPF